LEDGMIELTEQRKARLMGSLFHDIGKFQYRAEKTKADHGTNSSYFIREYLGRFHSIKPFLEEAIRMAADHHKEYADDAIKKADGMSASERVKDDHYFAHRPLLSIFRQIHIGKGKPSKYVWYVRPGALNIENIFPNEETIEPQKWKPNVVEMRSLHIDSWTKMKQEIAKLPETLPFHALFDTLFAILERWTTHVCSAGYGFTPDISLFDHSRAVAAYADCLAESDNNEKPFLVIEGDISGIQNFIYKLANPSDADQKKTAKTLRGRSLYVNLLSDSAADYILNELGLFKIHLLMNGGGHFHVLAPNTKKIEKKIINIERNINRWLIYEHQGELGLVLAYDAFSVETVSNYNEVKNKISFLLSEKKEKKNFNLLTGGEMFGPFEPGVKEEFWDVCKICGRDMKKTSERVCPLCNSQRLAGQILPKTKYLVKVRSQSLPPQSEYQMLKMDGLNTVWVFVTEPEDLYNIMVDFPKANQFEINTINQTDFVDRYLTSLQKDQEDKNVVLGFKFMGKHTPLDKGDILSFEDLSMQGYGYPLLHVLRMDVDNLGQIFAFGLRGGENVEERKYYSLSRIASLSREMNLFFSGYINKLAEDHQVYITYSGGDDLFVVGKWNKIIKFAQSVREDFRRFTCYNPNLTISGGAALVRPNFPIRRAAELAGELESLAKHHNDYEKDAISVFNTVYSWERADALLDWAEKMVDLIQKDETTNKYRSLLRYFKELGDEYFFENEMQDIDWIWKVKHKINYALARRAEINHQIFSAKYSDDVQSGVQDTELLKLNVLGRLISDPKLLADISMPVTYALLETRKNN